jgi:hypothetical protein
MLSLDPFLQPSHMGVLGTRTSSVIVSLRSPTCFTPAMTAVGAAPCLDAGIRPHFAICFILFQFTSLSSNQQYHSPFSSVVERGTCTIAQACRGHSFNPGRGHYTSIFFFLVEITPQLFCDLSGRQVKTQTSILENKASPIHCIVQ